MTDIIHSLVDHICVFDSQFFDEIVQFETGVVLDCKAELQAIIYIKHIDELFPEAVHEKRFEAPRSDGFTVTFARHAAVGQTDHIMHSFLCQQSESLLICFLLDRVSMCEV